ncbi:uncharacterized protein LOC124258565 isoform X4 [Haliotis rubra]|uniref:uncharacterized protein LOC124258565 isoform X4 n=1 Tax=Haliotis rubra TaxID=36100 RepID=UPI001EE58508|nr:uncharacterized protein LOC124258565 isoform X4 [Haliotis rubra]
MSSRIQAQGYGHDFISSDDILVVPNFRTNEDLKNAICNRLNSKIMTKTVTERQPLPISKHPRLIVFRPSGRAGDEFQDNVTPHLTDPDRTYYLIIASTTNPMEMFNLKQVSVQRFQKQKTGLTITIGKLDENEFNSTALQGLARAICEEYSHYVELSEAYEMKHHEHAQPGIEIKALVLLGEHQKGNRQVSMPIYTRFK